MVRFCLRKLIFESSIELEPKCPLEENRLGRRRIKNENKDRKEDEKNSVKSLVWLLFVSFYDPKYLNENIDPEQTSQHS